MNKIKKEGDPYFSANALEVLKRRYLLKDAFRNIIETPDGLFRRVAEHIAAAEGIFKSRHGAKKAGDEFYRMMRDLEFMPNSPTLMNSGTNFGQLSACFVLPVGDSIGAIFETLKIMARIHQTGGGTGFNFSGLRPRGDLLSTTKGEASGPVSFMRIFDEATGVILQGGRRRGANMGILNCDHPDIEEFIKSKARKYSLSNFNISVAVTDKFMEALRHNGNFDLINPRTGQKARGVNTRSLFGLIVDSAWKCGDPGLVFMDQINRDNPTPGAGRIEATNPCGELPLLSYESCNLASINLSKMVKNNRVDWERLRSIIHSGVRFLDDVIEVNKFPLPRIKEITFANRKIGLGVMGFADMLIKLGLSYNSREAVDFARKLMYFTRRESINASLALAKERGVFPNFRKSIYLKKNLRLRNATLNTIAPTGTISIICGCSSGIEPLFALSFIRNVLSGTRLFEINPRFEEAARARGFYSRGLMDEISGKGSIQKVRGIPEDIKKLFVSAFDVKPIQHLKIQAAFQRYTDNSVSKTINLPQDATPKDIRDIYLLAYKLRCKGITIYRYGSKAGQALSFGRGKNRRSGRNRGRLNAGPEYSGGCPAGACPI